MSRPADALSDLATLLAGERTVISAHVRQSDEEPALGLLAAAGPRAEADPAGYAVVVEAVREGYLLHYREPRLLTGMDADLALLAGDYLYALGLERLAAFGDAEAIRELADLISLQAQLHAGADPATGAEPLWLAATVAIAAGGSPEHERAKEALRAGDPAGPRMLAQVASDTASRTGLADRLEAITDSIDFASGGTA